MKILKAIIKEIILPLICLLTLFAPALILEIEGVGFGVIALLIVADLAVCLASGFTSGVMTTKR